MAALTDTELNRATLARQGLLEPLDLGVADGLRAIGAVQAQQWTAVPVALATRLSRFEPAHLWAALDGGDALAGIGIRGTLHLVAADEHPAYAATAAAGGIGDPAPFWPEPGGPQDAEADAGVAAAVLAAAAGSRLAPADIAAVAEAWVTDHPDAYSAAALEARRDRKWRPLARRPDLVRVPATGAWSAKTPAASTAAPWVAEIGIAWRDDTGSRSRSLEAAVRAHLRAFGPAAAADTAQWLGIPVPLAREALARVDDLMTLEGPGGATLHDLADAPRPGADVPAPPRFLAAFDSLLLAYAPGARGRVLTPEGQAAIYKPGNLRIDPAFLVDGVVAGTWTLDVAKRRAAIGLQPLAKLRKRDLAGLEREGRRLLGALAPGAGEHLVAVTS